MRFAKAESTTVVDVEFMGDVLTLSNHPCQGCCQRMRRITAYSEPGGFSDLNDKTPFKVDAILRIYSMTKPITSVGAMRLCEQGRFKLDDPVSLYILAFSNANVLQKVGNEVERVAPADSLHARPGEGAVRD